MLHHKINHKKLARFSRLLRRPAWKRTGPILVSALHKSVTYLHTYLDTHFQSREVGPTRGGHVGDDLLKKLNQPEQKQATIITAGIYALLPSMK